MTSALENMARNLEEKIDSGLYKTQNASVHLANNIATKIQPRTIEAIISKIPIYIIIAHSALDVNYSMPNFPYPGDEEVCIDGEHACFFTSNNGTNGEKIPSNNLKKWLENQARFVYYPTPPGEAGGLMGCPADENEEHILRNSMNNIRASILTGSNFLKTLRDDGARAYGTEKTIASAFLPGSFIPDKKHQFFGSRLSYEGFGIIKLSNTGQKLNKPINDIITPKFLNDDGFFYASNTSERPPAWIRGIANRSMNEEEIPMSDIVREGGAGFYISLSCSVLKSSVYPNCNSPVRGSGFPLQLLPMAVESLNTDIAKFHDNVVGQFNINMHGNNLLWEDFFGKILPHRVSRGKKTLEFSTFGDFNDEGYGSSTRKAMKRRKARKGSRVTRAVKARNEDARSKSDYEQFTNYFLKNPRRSQRRPQYQEQEPSVCKSNPTNAACILGATAVGAKLGGIKGACVGAACGAAMVGTKRLLKKKEKINGGRRKKTKKQRRKKSRSRRRKRTRRRKKY